MDKSYQFKKMEELETIIQKSPVDSWVYQEAKKEINRRNFWKKDIIAWVSLLIGVISLSVHILKYLQE